jgi:hypothetical protein
MCFLRFLCKIGTKKQSAAFSEQEKTYDRFFCRYQNFCYSLSKQQKPKLLPNFVVTNFLSLPKFLLLAIKTAKA